MKKFFSKLMKDTRGVVMMEYIILGLFAVAVTVAAVNVLGQAYNNGLLAMAKATIGDTEGTVATVNAAADQIVSSKELAHKYADELVFASASAPVDVYDYPVYNVGN